MKQSWLLMGCFIVCPVFAEPLLITKSNHWNINSKLVVEDCMIRNSLKQKLNPIPEWNKNSKWLDLVYINPPQSRIFGLLQGYEDFKIKNQKRETMLYGLANESILGHSILYQFDINTGQTVDHFILPIKIEEGTLLRSDVYFGNRWHTMLVLTATNNQSKNSLLMVFDVTEPRQKIKPYIHYDDKILSMINAKPKVIRLKSGNFGIVVPAYQNNKGILHIILFDEAKTLIPIELNTLPISTMLAVDINQIGVVDKIYFFDTEHLYCLDMRQVHSVQIKQLIALKSLKSLFAVPNENKTGIRLYFIAQILDTKGLYSLEVENESDRGALLVQPQLVIKGEYENLFLRFGHLIAIPKQEKEDPIVFSLANSQGLKLTKSPMNAYHSLVTETTTVLASRLLWDIDAQQEVLLVLNSSCQLNIYDLQMNKAMYGRTAWRKIKKF